MLEVPQFILDRAAAEKPIFTADEVDRWPEGMFAFLESHDLIRETDNASSVVCDACGHDHVKPVVKLPLPDGKGFRAYIVCDLEGRIQVPLRRLRQWMLNVPKLSEMTGWVHPRKVNGRTMPSYKDFTDKVYSCLSTAATLWPWRPGYQPAEPNEVRAFQAVTINALAKLQAELTKIKTSGVDLDIFTGHHTEKVNYHRYAIQTAEADCRHVMEAAYGVATPAGSPRGIPSLVLFAAERSGYRDYAEKVVENWSAVIDSLQSLPQVDLSRFWNDLDDERVKAERAPAVGGQADSTMLPAANLDKFREDVGPSNKMKLQGKRVPAKRSWTQPDLDDAIRKYKAERASTYGDLVAGVKLGKRGALKDARSLFGRNAIARTLGVKAPAMVSNSAVWQAIADELRLRGAPKRQASPPRQRIGMDIAIEEKAAATCEPVADQMVRHETIRLVKNSMPKAEADATIEKLDARRHLGRRGSKSLLRCLPPKARTLAPVKYGRLCDRFAAVVTTDKWS